MKRWLILGALLLVVSAAALRSERTWSFDKDKAGLAPNGFKSEVGEWKVAFDADARSKPNVLAQSARNSGGTFNLILVDGTDYKDLDLSVKMKAVAGREDQGGGLVWRAKNSRNYYITRFNPLEDNFRVYKVENGRRSEFQSANVKGDKKWHTLRASMAGDHIECYLDGKKLLDVRDSTFPSGGMIGLWTKADAQSRFDDLSVSTP